jgi:hypothetical protein
MVTVDQHAPVYSDEAKRCSDIMTLHRIAGSLGKWVAIRLADGGSDEPAAYDTRRDAVIHNANKSACMYVPILPGPTSPAEASALLEFARWAHRNGHRIFDPSDPDPVMPVRDEDLRALLKRKKL